MKKKENFYLILWFSKNSEEENKVLNYSEDLLN